MDSKTIREVMKQMGRRSARKRLAGMTPEQLSQWGRHAVNARWARWRAAKATDTKERQI